jgi:peptidoglycan/xylan/chitin deacetylase (PgdA/CDA1 family)
MIRLPTASALVILSILHFLCFPGEGTPLLPEKFAEKYRNASPVQWGEHVSGTAARIAAEGKEVALTFDACGGKKGSAVDWELLDFLRRERIPATLFLSGRWLAKNRETARELAGDPLFEIGNHGAEHRPLSVTGRSAYGIPGTESVTGAAREVEANARLLEEITGRRPRYFRSGTNHYDEVAVRVAADLGHTAVSHSHNGDGGASYPKKKIVEGLLSLRGGEIVLFHMNRPDGRTWEGLKEALPLLRKKGFIFVRLSDRPLFFEETAPGK